MNIDWGWVQHLLESKNLESLEEKATRLEDMAAKAEKEAEFRTRIAKAQKRIKATKSSNPLSHLGGGSKLLIGLVILVVVILVLVKGCG